MGGPNPNDQPRPHQVGKHAPGGTTAPVNTAANAGATTGFKRSFRRAQRRCTQNHQGYTTYQGKLIHGSQLGLHSAQTTSQPSARKRSPVCRRRGGHTQRLKILSINVNSLGGFLWSEVKIFLGEEGLQYDFIFLQETHRSSSSAFQIDKWMAVGSATKRGEGVLTLVNPKYDASMVRYQEIVPGRVLRVKVCRDESATETLNVYQHVWVHTDEPEHNLQRRQLLLDRCAASIQEMARRDTLKVAGDFNSEVQQVPRLIGHSLHCSEYHKALDPHTLTRFVQNNELVVLNTWRLKDPCTNYTRTGNSQIDFIMVRILSADSEAKRVHKRTAPFGAWKEMTHQALIADVRVIRHFHLPRPLSQTHANYAAKDLDRAYRAQDPQIHTLAQRVQQKLESLAAPTADQVNQVLLRTVADIFPAPSRGKTGHSHGRAVIRAFFTAWHEIITQPDGLGGSVISLPTRVYHLWQRRRDLLHSRLYDASGIIRTWKWIVLYMRAGRQSKQYHSQSQRAITLGYLQQAEQAAQQHNTKRLFGIIKRMIPWKPRPRIMLRHPDGVPMSLLQEHRALVQHCQQLFAPEVAKPARQGEELTMPVTGPDWTLQLRRTPIGKAVPADSAPATAWKACSAVLAPALAVRSRKGLSRSHRVRIWRTCVVSSAMYGLLTTPFNGHMVAKLRAWFHRNLRAVVNMSAHLTKISNKELRHQFALQDPIQMIEQRMDKKIKQLQSNHGDEAIRGQGVVNYWQTLHLQLQQAANSPTSAVIVETATAEQHACPTCGMYYPTKKALRQHHAPRHGQIQADKVSIVYKPEQHSIGGMPQCSHCHMKLYNWQALKGHIMLNVCNWYQPSKPTAVTHDLHREEPVLTDARDTEKDTSTQPPRNSLLPRMSGSPPPGMKTPVPYCREHKSRSICAHMRASLRKRTYTDIT